MSSIKTTLNWTHSEDWIVVHITIVLPHTASNYCWLHRTVWHQQIPIIFDNITSPINSAEWLSYVGVHKLIEKVRKPFWMWKLTGILGERRAALVGLRMEIALLHPILVHDVDVRFIHLPKRRCASITWFSPMLPHMHLRWAIIISSWAITISP